MKEAAICPPAKQYALFMEKLFPEKTSFES